MISKDFVKLENQTSKIKSENQTITFCNVPTSFFEFIEETYYSKYFLFCPFVAKTYHKL